MFYCVTNVCVYLLAYATRSIKWNYKLTHTAVKEKVVEGWDVSDKNL